MSTTSLHGLTLLSVKPWKGMDPSFLDLSASASGGQETEEDEEEDFYLDDELDDFIVNSVSTKCVFFSILFDR